MKVKSVLVGLALLSLGCILSGCAHVSAPKEIPELELKTVGLFSEKMSVDLINEQPNKSLQVYAGIGGHTYSANYNEWTQFFIDKLGHELQKRGVTVSENSENKLRVKLSDFAFIQGMWKVRVNMKIYLAMTEKNWSKEWVATDVSGWSAGRAFGSAVYHAIEQILTDKDMMKLLENN